MIRKLTILGVVSAAALAVAPTGAGAQAACSGTVIEVPAQETTLYIDNRQDTNLDVFPNVWIYEETNGITGLQPDVAAEQAVEGNIDDSCATDFPDTLLF